MQKGDQIRTLYITERASFGARLAEHFHCRPYAEAEFAKVWGGDGTAVISLGGPLARLAEPEDYEPGLQDWARLDLLPFLPDAFRWRVDRPEAARLLRDTCRAADAIVIATDPTREGEKAGVTALGIAEWTGAASRLWRSDNSRRSLATALRTLRPIEETAAYAQAAFVRAEGDLVEGVNCTRIADKKIRWRDQAGRPTAGPRVRLGRVQGSAFALVARADSAHEAWRGEQVFGLVTTFSTTSGDLKLASIGIEPITDRGQAERECRRASKLKSVIIRIESIDRHVPPPDPFDASLLEVTAAAAIGFEPARTRKTLDLLYDSGIITERNAERRRYGPMTSASAPATVASLTASGFWPGSVGRELRADMVDNKLPPFVHGAIAPTGETAGFELMTDAARADALDLFRLIVRRFAAAHCPDAIETISTAECIDESLRRHRGATRRELERGWKAVLNAKDDPSWITAQNALSSAGPDRLLWPWASWEVKGNGGYLTGHVPAGLAGLYTCDATTCERVLVSAVQEGRLTEARLHALMEDASPAIDPEILAELPEGPHPIGAASTRKDVIEKLIGAGSIFRDSDRTLRMTSAGLSLFAFLSANASDILDVSQAVAFEHLIRSVESGVIDPDSARAAIQTRNLRLVRALLAAPAFEGEAMDLRRFPEPAKVGTGDRQQSPATKPTRGNQHTPGQFPQQPQSRGETSKKPASAKTANSPKEAPDLSDAPTNAVWLQVSFEKKDKAKTLGARFCGQSKRWWVDPRSANWRRLRAEGFL